MAQAMEVDECAHPVDIGALGAQTLVHVAQPLAPGIARDVFNLPLLTWTVRNEADKANAQLFADAMIFEGIVP